MRPPSASRSAPEGVLRLSTVSLSIAALAVGVDCSPTCSSPYDCRFPPVSLAYPVVSPPVCRPRLLFTAALEERPEPWCSTSAARLDVLLPFARRSDVLHSTASPSGHCDCLGDVADAPVHSSSCRTPVAVPHRPRSWPDASPSLTCHSSVPRSTASCPGRRSYLGSTPGVPAAARLPLSPSIHSSLQHSTFYTSTRRRRRRLAIARLPSRCTLWYRRPPRPPQHARWHYRCARRRRFTVRFRRPVQFTPSLAECPYPPCGSAQ